MSDRTPEGLRKDLLELATVGEGESAQELWLVSPYRFREFAITQRRSSYDRVKTRTLRDRASLVYGALTSHLSFKHLRPEQALCQCALKGHELAELATEGTSLSRFEVWIEPVSLITASGDKTVAEGKILLPDLPYHSTSGEPLEYEPRIGEAPSFYLVGRYISALIPQGQ